MCLVVAIVFIILFGYSFLHFSAQKGKGSSLIDTLIMFSLLHSGIVLGIGLNVRLTANRLCSLERRRL
jgi:ABC-type Fe3+ transport system permease subunit